MDQAIAVGFLLGLACVLAVALAIANARLKVYEDPRVEQVQSMLPNNNCGACGLPGCRAFAEQVVGGSIQPAGCTVGGPETAATIAEFLGVDAGQAVKRTARLLCAGGSNVAAQMAEYHGHPSCRSASTVAGGGKACRYGCLGYGDCFDVCDFDAIRMSPTGLPIIDADKCTACGDCIDVCPKRVLELYPVEQRLIVQCKSELEGDPMLDMCRVACTGCARCIADASENLLKMRNNLPVFNRDLMHTQTAEATRRCPTGAIVWLEDTRFQTGIGEDIHVVSQAGQRR
ncbi:MAG TPA: RnfABCDGE type electron transport complex subunit B [Candidatus Krumholzibacteria bacterium]|nr:RnfABCDGE type electron transport complex subunit B [Candidatus Krumholzibacteria bacterium]